MCPPPIPCWDCSTQSVCVSPTPIPCWDCSTQSVRGRRESETNAREAAQGGTVARDSLDSLGMDSCTGVFLRAFLSMPGYLLGVVIESTCLLIAWKLYCCSHTPCHKVENAKVVPYWEILFSRLCDKEQCWSWVSTLFTAAIYVFSHIILVLKEP